MKSLRLYPSGELRLQDEPIPSPKSDQELIRVKAVGICGSDLHWFTESGIGENHLDRPLVLGHEFAGEIESGQRVAVDPAIPCRNCEYCRRGHPNLCPEVAFAGFDGQDGALREWLAWDVNLIHPLPDSLTYIDGAMLEPLGIALHAIDLAKLKAGMTIGVFGCGPIGLLTVQLSRLMGATNIIATDIFPHRIKAALDFGAHYAFLSANGEEVKSVLEMCGGRGVDVAFEFAGEQGAVDTSVVTAIPGGKVILGGIPLDDTVSIPASAARRKGLTIKFVRRMAHTYPRAVDLVSKGLVDVRSLVSHRFPLNQASEAFRVAVRREGLKVMIEL